MNSQTAGLRVAGLIFGCICLGHLWRLLAHVDVQLGQYHVPMAFSVVALLVMGALSIWLLLLSKR
ncbi:MAG: hypothetical protein ABJB69_03090 [Spartobacteria bacterium]